MKMDAIYKKLITPKKMIKMSANYKSIIDCKKIDNIFNIAATIETQISLKKYDPIENKLYMFAISNDKIREDNLYKDMYYLLNLSELYNASFFILYNKCNLYDHFRLKIDYTLLHMANVYNCSIITTRQLDNEYIKYGTFPYYCSMFQNGNYSKIKIE